MQTTSRALAAVWGCSTLKTAWTLADSRADPRADPRRWRTYFGAGWRTPLVTPGKSGSVRDRYPDSPPAMIWFRQPTPQSPRRPRWSASESVSMNAPLHSKKRSTRRLTPCIVSGKYKIMSSYVKILEIIICMSEIIKNTNQIHGSVLYHRRRTLLKVGANAELWEYAKKYGYQLAPC